MSDIEEDKLISCTVPKFHVPSCFWLLFDEDVPKRNAFNEKLNNKGVTYTLITDIDTNTKSVNKRVILQYEEQWVRGEVAQVKKDLESRKEYLCWLLDYGIFITTSQIYKLPADAQREKPFVRKAMLYGMISSVKGIDYDGVNQVQDILETEWSPGLVKLANSIIKNQKILKFKKNCIYEELLIGELFLYNAEGEKNIRDLLLASNLAAFDQDIFLENLHHLKMTQKPMATIFLQTKFFSDDEKFLTECQIRSCGRGTFRTLKKDMKEIRKKLASASNADLFCDAENDKSTKSSKKTTVPKEDIKPSSSFKKQGKSTADQRNTTTTKDEKLPSLDKKKILDNLESTGRGKKLKELLAKRKVGTVSEDESDSSKDDSINNLSVKSDSPSSSGRGFRNLREGTEKETSVGRGKQTSHEHTKKEEMSRSPVGDYENFEDAENKLESTAITPISSNIENKSLSVNPGKIFNNATKTSSLDNISGSGRGFSKSSNKLNGANISTDNISAAGHGFIKPPNNLNRENTSTENISVAGRGFSKSVEAQPILNKDNTHPTENKIEKVGSAENSPGSSRDLSKSSNNSATTDTSSKGRANLKIMVGNKEVSMNLFSDLVKSSPDKLLATAFGRGVSNNKNDDPIRSEDLPLSAKSSDSESSKFFGRGININKNADDARSSDSESSKSFGRGIHINKNDGPIRSEDLSGSEKFSDSESSKSFGRGIRINKNDVSIRSEDLSGSEKFSDSESSKSFGRGIRINKNDDPIRTEDLSVSAKSSDSESSKSFGRGIRINKNDDPIRSEDLSGSEKFSDSESSKSFGRGIRIHKNDDTKSSDSESIKSFGRSTKSSESEKFSNAKEEQIMSFGRGFTKVSSVKLDSENNKLTNIDETNEQIISTGRGFGKKSDSETDNLTNTEEEVKSIDCSSESETKSKRKPYKKPTSSIDDSFDDADEVSKSDTSSKKSSVFRESAKSVDVPIHCHPAGASIKPSKPSDDPNFIATAYENRPPIAAKDTAELLKQFGKNFKSDENPKPNEPKQKNIPGFCQCKSCTKWRTGDNVFEPSTNEVPRPQKPKFIMKPPLLFKTDDYEGKTFKIETKRAFDTYTDKLAAPRILVHGFMQASSTPDLPHTPFDEKIQSALKQLKYDTAFSIQTYTWPAILRGLSTFVIGAPECGKTMVYVPAICNASYHKIGDLSEVNGPTAIVLCPQIRTVENVYRLFSNILRKVRSDTNVQGITHLTEKLTLLRLSKGVDILVTTPRLFIKILKDGIISMDRVCHVVLEDAHDLFPLFSPEVEYILKKTQKVLENRTECIQAQLIVISQEWSKPIEDLSKKIRLPPLVCIGAHLEAALYGKAEIKMQFSTSQDKPAKLIKIVENIFQHRKTIIICNDSDDSKELLQYLETNGILYKTLLFESTVEDINAIKERWLASRVGSLFVLVCSDNIFNTGLAISDAEVIIQYSLPENWSQFTFRFSGFLDSYSSPLITKPADMKSCMMHIMIDETNTKQIPKLLQFLRRMGTKVTQSLSNMYDQLNLEMEQNKLDNKVSICEKLLSVGSCKNHISCKYRHLLNPVTDVFSYLPQSGIIKFKVINIKDPVQYNGRLIQHIDADGITHDYGQDFGTIVTKLLALSGTFAPVPSHKLEVGYQCAVKETDGPSKGSFQRCKVLELIGLRHKKKLRVLFIDIGQEQCVLTSQVYHLPKLLREIPPQFVRIHIANVGPPDFDVSWPSRTITLMTRQLKEAGQTNAATYFTARIKLQLGNTIFVDDLKLQEVLDDDFIFQKMSVRDTLSKYKALEKRPNHLKKLYELCKKYKIPLHDYSLPVIKKSIKIEPQATPQWAHLENSQEFNTVFFAMAYNPESFFVKLSKYSDCLEQLNKDIVEAMNKPFYKQVISPVEGHCYLVRDPDPLEETYARAIVKKLNDTTADCFFVDYGDSIEVAINEIKYLPDELITKLPFQVIECELYGIGPSNIEGNWLSETTDIFYDIAYEPGTDLFRFLYVKVMGEEKSQYTGFKKYSVILCDIFEDKNVIVNNLLLDMGYAFPTTEQKIEIEFEELRNKISNTESGESSDDEKQENEHKQLEPIEEDDEDEWDFQVNDPEEFFRSFLKLSDEKPTKKTLPTIKESDSQTYGTTIKALPMPSSGHSTPNVIWQQTDSHIILKVQIPDTSDYQVKLLGGRMLNFKATRGETSYRLQLNLFAKVNQKCIHSNAGLYIMIKLKKIAEGEWSRLILNKEKQRYITYNVADIPVDDDSDDDTPLPQNMIESSKILGEQLSKAAENGPYVFEYGSDIDWDESDIESNEDSSED